MTLIKYIPKRYRRRVPFVLMPLIIGSIALSACGRDETDTLPTASPTTSTATVPTSSTDTQTTARTTTQPKPSGGDAQVRACIRSWNKANPGKQLTKEMAKSGPIYVSVVSIAHQSPPTGPGDCRMDFALAGKGPSGRAGSYTTDASGKWCCFDNTVLKVGDLTPVQQKWNARANASGRVTLGAPKG
jgi:hypothetical protein